MLSTGTLSGKHNNVVLNMHEYVNVYLNAESDIVLCILTPYNEYLDAIYDAEILDKKSHRLKLNITMLNGLEMSGSIVGWVEISQCGVFIRCNSYGVTNKEPLLYLYESPSIDSEYEVVNIKGLDGTWINIQDVSNDMFKIRIPHDNIYVEGWIYRCCTDPYNSCT